MSLLKRPVSRRGFLTASAAGALTAMPFAWRVATTTAEAAKAVAPEVADEGVVDIHQHTHYHARSDEAMLRHQRAMGIRHSILLPAGRLYGLAAQCGGNQTVVDFCRAHPKEFSFCANELPDIPQSRSEIEKYLKLGAVGIAEQKFNVPCDSPSIRQIAELAREYRVPVLLHFQHGEYNTGFENFHRILEAFPEVNFIGHAQTWWNNVGQVADPTDLYPKGDIRPGGITDRYLRDYPNMYGDLSAGSGLNFLVRDEAFAREFLIRHQDKLIYGSDCADELGKGPGCQGAQTLAQVLKLVTDPRTLRKLLRANALKVFRLKIG